MEWWRIYEKMKSHPHAGKFNLKGKKYKLLSCKCCVVQDFRDREKNKEDKKEIAYWSKNNP